MREIWKNIINFEDLYQISNKGSFRRHPDKQCKTCKNPKPLKRGIFKNRLGYLYICLSKNNKTCKKTVHQVMAAAFLPNFTYGMHVNHIDGNKTNNYLSNIEITTFTDNNLHAHKLGLIPKPGKSIYHNVNIRVDKRHKNPKKSYLAAIKSNSKRIFCKYFKSEIEAAKAVDAFLDSINDTKRNRNFPHLKCPTTIPQGSTLK